MSEVLPLGVTNKKDTRLFAPHVRAIVQALQDIFDKNQYADKVIERTLKADKRRGSSDRAFIAYHVYEMLRYYRFLYYIDGREPRTEADWWRLFGIQWVLSGHNLPPWREFTSLDPALIHRKEKEAQQTRKIRESIPDWLDKRGEQELGETWTDTIAALNRPAQVVLRANTLKTDARTLQQTLLEKEIETKQLGGAALLVTERKNLFRTDAFQQGHFELQDWSSQQVGLFCEVEPGMRVIDACAGAGGKSLHLANLMQNKGQLIALDTESWKLNELRKRSKRNGIHIIETRPITSAKVIKRLRHSADRLLLDVPCSGLGVLRRNPDAKWKLSTEFIERVRQIQIDILTQYAKMARPTAKIIYATCSILPSENQLQVERFLQTESGLQWQLEADKTILPQQAGFDGFYMARLSKKQNHEPSS